MPLRALLIGLLTLALIPVLAGPTASAQPADDWHGSRQAKPSAYAWLDDGTPDVDYELIVVRGLTVGQVRPPRHHQAEHRPVEKATALLSPCDRRTRTP
ncbi:hypothetical protein GCM10023350_21440 [Nocardioides endophyticus]|uniref:Uncharacterized protein n=1 Tax=Nocardioides endophyticus TaxID=1353775 RepID=A0ABP8YUY1_9ACTN